MLRRNPRNGSAVPCYLSNSSGGWQQAGRVRSGSWYSPSLFEQLGDLVDVFWGATFAVSSVESTCHLRASDRILTQTGLLKSRVPMQQKKYFL